MIEKKDDQYESPVKRLYEILENALSNPGPIPIRDVWSKSLGIEKTDILAVYLALADLVKLFDDAKKNILQLDDVNRDYYLEPFLKIEDVIKHSNLDEKWDRISGKLDAVTMLSLKLASNTDSNAIGMKAISDDKLKKLQSDAEDLLEKVVAADFLSEELRRVLLEQLENIRRSILLYRVSGFEGMRRAVESTLGGLILNREQIEDVINDGKDKKGIIRNLITLLSDISQIASLGFQAAQLSSVLPLLLNSG